MSVPIYELAQARVVMAPIMMMVLLAFIGGVVLLFFKQTRFIAAVCLSLAVVAPMAAWFLHHSGGSADIASQTPPAVMEIDADILKQADAHPSAALAVNALVYRLERNVGEIVPNVNAISMIHYPWALPEPIAIPMREGLQRAFPFSKLNAYTGDDIDESFVHTLHPEKKAESALEAEVRKNVMNLGKARVKPSPSDVVLRIDYVPGDEAKKDWNAAKEGQLRLTAHGPDGKQMWHAVSFFSKPWAADPAGYASTVKGAEAVIAFSPPEPVREDAIDQARSQAALQVLQRLEPQIVAAVEGRTGNYYESARRAVVAHVRDKSCDQFVQKLQMDHGGTVYRAGVLVTLDDETRNKLVEAAVASAGRSRDRHTSTFLSIAGLAVVILLLYFFLNAVTRGYFQFSLRALTLLLLAVGIVVIMAVV